MAAVAVLTAVALVFVVMALDRDSTLTTAVAVVPPVFPPAASATSSPLPSSSQAVSSEVIQPVVSSVSPPSGPLRGGTTVTISGTGLTGTLGVIFGAVAANTFTVVSDTSVTAVSPAQSGGVRNTYVVTQGGTSAAIAGDQFTYRNPPPAVRAVSPSSGPVVGGTLVTITGSGFTGASRVVFGGLASTSFKVVSDTSITATSPAQPSGVLNTYVVTPVGTSAVLPDDQFTYR